MNLLTLCDIVFTKSLIVNRYLLLIKCHKISVLTFLNFLNPKTSLFLTKFDLIKTILFF